MEILSPVQQIAQPVVITEPELFDRYVAYIDASEATVRAYTSSTRNFVQYLLDHGVTAPRREDVIAYRDDLKAQGYKPSTIQSRIIAVRLFFQWLEQSGLYPDVAKHVKAGKVSTEHKRDYLTRNQLNQVFDGVDTSTLQGKRDYAILVLMSCGGLRCIEVSRAMVDDLRTVGEDCVLFVWGKGRTEAAEYVRIPPEVEAVIRQYLAARRAKSGEPLFVSISNNSAGHAITTRSISRLVKTHFREAGFDSDRLVAHSLRHSAVTIALLEGEDAQHVQEFARHKSFTTTMRYAHNLDRAKNTCSRSVASAIFTPRRPQEATGGPQARKLTKVSTGPRGKR